MGMRAVKPNLDYPQGGEPDSCWKATYPLPRREVGQHVSERRQREDTVKTPLWQQLSLFCAVPHTWINITQYVLVADFTTLEDLWFEEWVPPESSVFFFKCAGESSSIVSFKFFFTLNHSHKWDLSNIFYFCALSDLGICAMLVLKRREKAFGSRPYFSRLWESLNSITIICYLNISKNLPLRPSGLAAFEEKLHFYNFLKFFHYF